MFPKKHGLPFTSHSLADLNIPFETILTHTTHLIAHTLRLMTNKAVATTNLKEGVL
jgi:hypothetical protein